MANTNTTSAEEEPAREEVHSAAEREIPSGSETSNINGDAQPAAADNTSNTPESQKQQRSARLFWSFFYCLVLDNGLTWLLPLIHQSGAARGSKFLLARSLSDLALLAVGRSITACFALALAYFLQYRGPASPFEGNDLINPNGSRKTNDEIEMAKLEEPVYRWVFRYLRQTTTPTELLAVATQTVGITKCLDRLYIELSRIDSDAHRHPIFWIAIFATTVLSLAQALLLPALCDVAAELGKGQSAPTMIRNLSSQLLEPLLSTTTSNGGDAENPTTAPPTIDPENEAAEPDITVDSTYKASWKDLARMCLPDLHLIMIAAVFLLLAAVAQVYIPKFLGHILDNLSVIDKQGWDKDSSIYDIPHFVTNVKLLVAVSILAGIFSGLRGSIFTIVGARVNVRLRVQLMDSLLAQDMGFFDVTKTGAITSRLSSDTTLVGDQVALNVNVFLRSIVQAVGVLIFMCVISWQLCIVAFISVPLITVLSKWYGDYVRSLTKCMQQKLADGNTVSESVISSMRTVRALDAGLLELRTFEKAMEQYLLFNNKSARAYFGFATMSTSLPQLVFAVVVFYGGMMVRNRDMTGGQLVTFLLYLQSLSDAFATIGWVFTSLTQAVGAADKVFELLHRKPKRRDPSVPAEPGSMSTTDGILGIVATKTQELRSRGLKPELISGEVVLEDVVFHYPARSKRKILDRLSLRVPSGSTVALVGPSGSGKSSILSLIQHLYEPSSGSVQLDGVDVHELSPSWLSKNVAVVSQEPTLFARSIKENIIYGIEDAPSIEEIHEAARLANAHDFIQDMPQGYDTEVAPGTLSGGQKQRVAIARALIRKPALLLLDEATSALDADSEYLVQRAIDEMLERGKGTMTVIVVAHRLSTVQNADRIMVIKEGKLVEEGTHHSLISNPEGAYANLIRRQQNVDESLENGSESEKD